jgi:hypothetical protein
LPFTILHPSPHFLPAHSHSFTFASTDPIRGHQYRATRWKPTRNAPNIKTIYDQHTTWFSNLPLWVTYCSIPCINDTHKWCTSSQALCVVWHKRNRRKCQLYKIRQITLLTNSCDKWNKQLALKEVNGWQMNIAKWKYKLKISNIQLKQWFYVWCDVFTFAWHSVYVLQQISPYLLSHVNVNNYVT